MMKRSLGFCDLDLIFKVTAELTLPDSSPKVLVYTISHELVGRFQPDFCIDITLGRGEELI